MKAKITFDKKSLPFIVEAIGYKTGIMGELLDNEDNPVLDLDKKPIFVEEIICIHKLGIVTRDSQMFTLLELIKKTI